MLKNTIIIILTLLLIITLYSYFCLSNKMIDFQQDRMNYIYNKEKEFKTMNSDIKNCSTYRKDLESCNLNLNQLKESIANNITDLKNDINNNFATEIATNGIAYGLTVNETNNGTTNNGTTNNGTTNNGTTNNGTTNGTSTNGSTINEVQIDQTQVKIEPNVTCADITKTLESTNSNNMSSSTSVDSINNLTMLVSSS
jgi:hypothetical protein